MVRFISMTIRRLYDYLNPLPLDTNIRHETTIRSHHDWWRYMLISQSIILCSVFSIPTINYFHSKQCAPVCDISSNSAAYTTVGTGIKRPATVYVISNAMEGREVEKRPIRVCITRSV